VRGEFAENSERKDFDPSEINAIRKALLPLENRSAQMVTGGPMDARSRCWPHFIAGRARVHALLKESTLHRAAGQSERDLEVFPRELRPPAAKLKLTKRCG
jgi:hypothetical protein